MSAEKDYLWDDRAPSFRLLADGARIIAKQNQVSVDDLTYRRWGDAGGLIRELDTLHDDFGVSTEEILARVEEYSEFKALYPHLSPDELEPEKRTRLLVAARNIFALGAVAAQATTAATYAPARYDEAAASADVITIIASDTVLAQPAYVEKFVPKFTEFTIGVTFFDSLLDAKSDYIEGKINVAPNAEYYREIYHMGRKAMRYSLGVAIQPAMAHQALRMARIRISTRLTHGMTEYSTMQNVPNFFKRNTRKKLPN